tara:strand:- start:4869 stop:5507 length:639 start_codon:yes stop_codon:yes gene_type:complete
MANDLMRTGPLGSTDQASKLGYSIVKLAVSVDGTPLDAFNKGKSAAISDGHVLTKATANSFGWLFPTHEPGLMGGTWVIETLYVLFETAAAANNITFDVGIYAQHPTTGAITVVDVDAVVDGYVLAHAAGTLGAMYEVPLNGLGGGLEYFNTAAGNKVTTTIGQSVGTFTSGDASVAGQHQSLYLTNTTSAGAGAYAVYAVCKPVGGTSFKS